MCLVVCATNVVLIHFTSAYHKTLECLEMTRRGQGANRRGNKGSIMVWGEREEITFERDTERSITRERRR